MFHFGGESNKFTCCMRRPPLPSPPLRYPSSPLGTRCALCNSTRNFLLPLSAQEKCECLECSCLCWRSRDSQESHVSGRTMDRTCLGESEIPGPQRQRLANISFIWCVDSSSALRLTIVDFLGSHLNYCCRFAKMICFEFK